MPMHDWTRVSPNDYHAFHLAWIASLQYALNTGVLPRGYFALAEHTTPPYVPDVVTLSPTRPIRPPARPEPAGGAVVTADPVATLTATHRGRKRRAGGRRRVVVRGGRERAVVAVIELVSPSNKDGKVEFDDLVKKSVELLMGGVHVLLIDPFPPTARDPHGLHAAVWAELTGTESVPPADKPLTLASYVALPKNRYQAHVEPTAVGDPLKPMALFLTDELHVMIPLEETYAVAWRGYPEEVREVVEGGP